MSDASKFLYLEVLDMTFSFDGVIGAFAFTINLILILIGIGVGALSRPRINHKRHRYHRQILLPQKRCLNLNWLPWALYDNRSLRYRNALSCTDNHHLRTHRCSFLVIKTKNTENNLHRTSKLTD